MADQDRRSVAIVVTTIFPLRFLPDYTDNILKFGHADHTTIYVIGDQKTPESCAGEAAQQARRGVDVRYLPLKAQADYMARFPELRDEIPINSDNRRNVGFLVALEEGAEVVISIDDDNFCYPDVDFVGEHMRCGTSSTCDEAVGDGGWFNICSLLESEPCAESLYPRGFPYGRRIPGTSGLGGDTTGRVAINVGLWARDPDVDAIGRLYANPQVSRWNGREVLLGPAVRTPINTQNTALSREAMAAYYYVRMGVPLQGMRIDRFGDIFSGYFAQRCAEAVGDRIRVGGPVVDHRRNRHDLLVDLWHELAGIMIIEDLDGFLTSPAEPASSYPEAYRSLSHDLEEVTQRLQGFIWTDETRAYFRKISSIMRIWADAYEEVTS